MDHLLLHLLLLLPPPVPCTSPLSLFWRLKGTAPWSDRSAIITTLYASSSFSWSDRTLFPPDLAAFARETSCLFSPFFRPPPHWSPLGSISLSISLSPVSSFPFHTSTPLCSSLPTRLISHLSSPPCSCKLGWVPQLDPPPPSCNCASSSSSSVGRSFCTIQTLASFLECPLYLPSIKCIASTWEKDGVPALDRRRPLLAILRCCCCCWWWWWWLIGGHHGGFGFDISPVDPIPNVQLENDCLLLPCMCEGLFFSFFFCPDGCECERENQPWILGRKICHYNLTLSKIVATRALNSGTNRKAETVRENKENWPACTGNRTHYAGAVISVTTAHAC